MYDEKCDVWSCGVIMYILLCGQPPFKGKSHKEIFEKIRYGKFSFIHPEWAHVSRLAKILIKKMLTYNPDERISAEEALNDEWILENTMINAKLVTDQL
jgi:calcium-dependent protein kinase